MTSQTTVKNGTVQIPPNWEGANVYIVDEGDTILIKRMEKPTLNDLRPRLLKAGKAITKKDLNDAIKDARKPRSTRRH